jgi:hypothetical protein
MYTVENPWGFSNFCQISWGVGVGVKAFVAKSQGVHYLGCNCIFINKFFENLLGGVLFHPLIPLFTLSSLEAGVTFDNSFFYN